MAEINFKIFALTAENLRELVATTQQVGVHDIRLAEMEVRFQCLETANYGGVLIWKVPDYTRRKLDAATNRVSHVGVGKRSFNCDVMRRIEYKFKNRTLF